MSTPPVYDLFGVRVTSSQPLPCARASDESGFDVALDYLGVTDTPLAPKPAWRMHRASPAGWILQYAGDWDDWNAFQYDAAERRLTVSGWAPWGDMLPVLLGPASAGLLRSLGVLVLHGAVVAKGGRAIALLGPTGAGKSCLAARLLAQGCELVSDDLVVLRRAGDEIEVASGPPYLSLRDEVAAAQDPAAFLSARRPHTGKLWLQARESPSARAATPRLAAVYVLNPREPMLEQPRMRALAPREALMALVSQIYGAEWLGAPDAAMLGLCGEIAGDVRVCRATLPDALEMLDDAATEIVERLDRSEIAYE